MGAAPPQATSTIATAEAERVLASILIAAAPEEVLGGHLRSGKQTPRRAMTVRHPAIGLPPERPDRARNAVQADDPA